ARGPSLSSPIDVGASPDCCDDVSVRTIRLLRRGEETNSAKNRRLHRNITRRNSDRCFGRIILGSLSLLGCSDLSPKMAQRIAEAGMNTAERDMPLGDVVDMDSAVPENDFHDQPLQEVQPYELEQERLPRSQNEATEDQGHQEQRADQIVERELEPMQV